MGNDSSFLKLTILNHYRELDYTNFSGYDTESPPNVVSVT